MSDQLDKEELEATEQAAAPVEFTREPINQKFAPFGGIAFTDAVVLVTMMTPDGMDEQTVPVVFHITSRAETVEQAIDGLRGAFDGEIVRPAELWAPRQQSPARQPTAPAQQQAAAPAQPARQPAGRQPAQPTGQQAARQPARPQAQNQAPAGRPENHLYAVRLSVEPRPDNKVHLDFFGAGRKWADIKATVSTELAIKLLSTSGDLWDANALARAADWQVSYDVVWVESERVSSSGTPYRDIVRIEPAQAAF